MFQEKVIDLSNYKPEDLIISGIQGGILSATTEGSPIVMFKARNSEIDADFNLAVINMGTLAKVDYINGQGAFLIPCSGIEKVTLSVSGSGKIKIKELG